jgi:hypothetical protein
MASSGRNSMPRIHADFREKIEKFVAEVLGLPVKNGRAVKSKKKEEKSKKKEGKAP